MLVKELIIQQLENFGVKHIYNFPGDTTLSFISALKDSSIKLFSTRHEGAAGLMASAESKLTGKISVCMSHSGPGTANILNGIADAASDRTPVLLISGQVETYNIGTDYKQYVNQSELTNPLTVYSSLLINPESIIDILYKALNMAISKGGVSQLIVPKDLWDMESSAIVREYPLHLNNKIIPDTKLIEQAAGLISQAERPVIIYGRGCRKSAESLMTIANKISAPLLSTLPAAGIIDYSFPLEMGILGQAGNQYTVELLEASDLIIIFAATWWPTHYTPSYPDIIQFDAVKENIASSHPVKLGIPGDISISLSALSSYISDYNLNYGKNPEGKQQWLDTASRIKNKFIAEINRGYTESVLSTSNASDMPTSKVSDRLSPSNVIKTVSECCQKDDIISLDTGDNTLFFGRLFGNKCRDILVSGSWRTMGFALPAGLTAKINYPKNNSIIITGDGGITMVIQELLTASRYNIPVTIIIMNNSELAMEKNRMIEANIEVNEMNLNNPDFPKLAESCGIQGIRVNNISELKSILQERLIYKNNNDQTLLIDVPISSPILPGTTLSRMEWELVEV